MTPAEREQWEIDEAACDAELERMGYSGDAKSYRRRLARIREMAEQNHGPLASHNRLMKRLGYVPRKRWPVLNFAWNEEPTPEWKEALARDARGELR